MDIQKYLDWCTQGQRAVEIEIDTLGGQWGNVWCYDYSIQAGAYVALGEDPPSDNSLRDRARLKTELKNLEPK